MKIEMCMGSSCHVKGAQPIYERLLKAIRENSLEDKVSVNGTMCLGQCKSGGVNLKIDGELVTGLTAAAFPEFFETKVKKAVSK